MTSILELGAWVGTLVNGYGADKLGRRLCTIVACCVFLVGIIVQACTENKDYVFAGRFVTGLGVGSLSMVVPLYNAELSPPEVRGSLVALQQQAITAGIMVAYWVSTLHLPEPPDSTISPCQGTFTERAPRSRSAMAPTTSAVPARVSQMPLG